jgi:hypothetical protein
MAKPLDVKLVKRGPLTVAVPERRVPTLTHDEVAETLASLRCRGMPARPSAPSRRTR